MTSIYLRSAPELLDDDDDEEEDDEGAVL